MNKSEDPQECIRQISDLYRNISQLGDVANFEKAIKSVTTATGSSSGIGAEVARKLAKLGHQVFLTGRNEDNLKSVATQCQEISSVKDSVAYLAGDICSEDHRRQLVEKTLQTFGHLDILINNAGCGIPGGIDQGLEDYDKMMDVNVKSVYALTQLAVPHLIKTKGNIVSTSSICGPRASEKMIIYSMAKAAIDAFTQALAVELGPKGVRVNAVNPATVRTGLQPRLMGEEKAKSYYESMNAAHPLGRVAEASEVADAIVYLSSEQASFVSGQLLFVSGARHCVCATIKY